ncbi:hypothetical protein [Methanohalophilus sp. WG1-DM]|uniref:hypothetical protein n=1 Tax=Methanohalophilus sp. WG1-DM TaxID=2491675 RepID=UPI000FFF6831|nr:hypothetical protein [Methanohalophilus sp. WG1-DM]
MNKEFHEEAGKRGYGQGKRADRQFRKSVGSNLLSCVSHSEWFVSYSKNQYSATVPLENVSGKFSNAGTCHLTSQIPV